MANPGIRHRHSAEQMLDLVPDVPEHIRRAIESHLRDRDESIEDGINQGLRYTRSVQALGNGAAVAPVFPAWVAVGNQVRLIAEKQHDASRFELDVAAAFETTVAVNSVVLGVEIAADDGTAFTTTVFAVAQRTCGVGFNSVAGHGSTGGTALPKGRYRLTLMVSTGGGGIVVTFNPASTMSMRVSESVY